MYHFITRQVVKRAFADLSSGKYEHHLQRFHPQAKLTVAGSPETRGTYQSIDGIKKAFEELYDYLPQHQFNLREIWIRGSFWNTRVAVAWIDKAKDRNGESVTRQGMNFIRIQWGKVVEEEIYWTSN